MLDISMLSDTQCEASLIATLVYHPEFILHTDYLKPGYFYNVENSCIYWGISELYKSGIDNIDAINLTNILNSNSAVKKKINEYNLEDLNEFINMAQYAARHTIEEYKKLVDTVVTLAFKRDLNKTLNELQSRCFDNTNLADLDSLVNTRISELTEKYIVSSSIELLGSQIDDLWQQIIDRREKSGSVGIPSKFTTLDKYFRYEAGELFLLCARAKRGKSIFMMNEGLNAVKNGVPTLFLDTEMSTRQWFERALSHLAKVEVRKIKYGGYDYDEEQRLKKAKEFLESAPLVHMYIPSPSNEEIFSIAKILKYKIGLGFMSYDYIKSDLTDASSLYNFLGARTSFLKNEVAGTLEIPIIAGAQLNRNNQIADSDKLLRYSSVTMMWQEKDSETIANEGADAGNYSLNVMLNRLGEQMTEEEHLNFVLNGNLMTINTAKTPVNSELNQTPFDE